MKMHIGLSAIALVFGAAGSPAGAAAPAAAGAGIAPAMLDLLRQIQADPARTEAALKEGARIAAVCANCHGDNGVSVAPDTPNLAGQNPLYLVGQMEKFYDGRRRYEFMEGMVKTMKPLERVSAMLYYSRQAAPPRLTGDAALRERGQSYFHKVCFRCHGPDGHGSEELARVAGQQPSYMTLALKRYRGNSDGARNDPRMREITGAMSDADIDAVAAYVASMP